MNTQAIQDKANKLHRTAKSGMYRFNGINYNIKFDHYQGSYSVADAETGEHIANFNTRKITEAKKWLRDWLLN